MIAQPALVIQLLNIPWGRRETAQKIIGVWFYLFIIYKEEPMPGNIRELYHTDLFRTILENKTRGHPILKTLLFLLSNGGQVVVE